MAPPTSSGRPVDPADLRTIAARVRLLVLDVDGVLTDGQLHFDAEGREFKTFHVRDGYGIRQVMAAGIAVAVISGRASQATAARLAELGVMHAHLGCDDKAAALASLLATLGIPEDDMACVGDDVPDLPVMARAGLSVAVADAHPRVLAIAHWRTALPGGRGAVREVCDLLLDARADRPGP